VDCQRHYETTSGKYTELKAYPSKKGKANSIEGGIGHMA
jgi:hypothetical protein